MASRLLHLNLLTVIKPVYGIFNRSSLVIFLSLQFYYSLFDLMSENILLEEDDVYETKFKIKIANARTPMVGVIN